MEQKQENYSLNFWEQMLFLVKENTKNRGQKLKLINLKSVFLLKLILPLCYLFRVIVIVLEWHCAECWFISYLLWFFCAGEIYNTCNQIEVIGLKWIIFCWCCLLDLLNLSEQPFALQSLSSEGCVTAFKASWSTHDKK